jgi:thiamine pyrophosphate-dependent acetolactate synthase large subunit-like protein
MNLGSLVTVIGTGVTNLSIVLIDNGLYEITGGQKTAAAGADIDYAGLARAAGFPNVAHFWDLTDWQQRAAPIFSQRGPRFIWLQVAPASAADLRHPASPMPQQLERLKTALQS